MSIRDRHFANKVKFLEGEVDLYCNTIDNLSAKLEGALRRLQKYEPAYVEAIMNGETPPTAEGVAVMDEANAGALEGDEPAPPEAPPAA